MPERTELYNAKALSCLWLSALLWLPVVGGSVAAADFSQAQHIYVPASMYERRIDTPPVLGEMAPPPPPTYKTGIKFSKPTSNSDSAKYKDHPYGKLPAPPVVPGAPTAAAVPPPPAGYPAALCKAARDLHSQIRQAAASPTVQAAYRQLKTQAEEYTRSGKLNEAKHAVAQALKLTPHDKALIRELAAISVERARQFMQSQDYGQAVQFARQALAFDAASQPAHSLLNGLLEKQGVNACDPEARLKQAELLAAQGQNDQAFVEYQAANNLKPSAAAEVGMGNIALRLGHNQLASSEYEQAARTDPHSSAALRQLALLKYQQGDVVGANAELTRALALEPKDTAAAAALIELWQNQVSRVPSANSHLGLARAYQLSGDLQSAQTEYRTVVQIDPNNSHLPAARQSFKLALARQEAQHDAEAAHTLESQAAYLPALAKMEEAVKLDPRDSDLQVYQGYLLEKLGRFGEAGQAYMAALKSNPHNLLAAARLKQLPPATLPPIWTPDGAVAGLSSGNAYNQAGYPQFQPAQHEAALGNISNFAFALRNHLATQQTQMNKADGFAHDHSWQSTAFSGSSDSLMTAATAGAGFSSPAPLSQSDSLSSSLADTLAQARAAVARASGRQPIGRTTSSAVMPPLAPSAHAWPASGSAAGPPAGLAATAADVPPDKSTGLPAAAALALPYTPGTNAQGPSPLPAPDWRQSTIKSAINSAPVSTSTLPGGFASGTAMLPEQSNAPALRAALPLADNGVKLQLLAADPKVNGVDLRVLLQNDADLPLILPRLLHAVIRYNGKRPDAEVKASFASSAVPAHGAAQGVVHVPYDKADPTADLVLPQLLPPTFAQRDVHLITSLAAR